MKEEAKDAAAATDAQGAASAVFANADAEQVTMMQERCILLDRDDRMIGCDTKKACHLLDARGRTLLHRAFSVFLFAPDGRLLLQKRSAEKITFPSYWANTCCSHPIFDFAGEQNGVDGVVVAARRKLQQELGIRPEQVPTESFTFLTRVHYQAPCDDTWGEHEIDYILVCRPTVEVELQPNPNEVAETRYFTQDELRAWMSTHAGVTPHDAAADASKQLVSPWFRIIHDLSLYKWLDNLSDLERVAERDTIHRGEGADLD